MSSLCNNYNTEAKLSSASLAIQTKKAAKSEKLDRSKGIGLILKKKNAQTVKYEISIERKQLKSGYKAENTSAETI